MYSPSYECMVEREILIMIFKRNCQRICPNMPANSAVPMFLSCYKIEMMYRNMLSVNLLCKTSIFYFEAMMQAHQE